MKYLKQIEPYNGFWGNCITNMLVSILMSRDPSYEPLIFMNDYEYSCDYSTGALFHINYTRDYYRYFRNNHFSFQYCRFANRESFFDEFKEVLINSPYISVNVDLYYWNREGAYFNKVHYPHFSFIIGFDEEEGIIYAVEDDTNLNYLIRKISMDDFFKAVYSEYKGDQEDYRIISFKNSELKPYILNVNQVVANAGKIISNLEAFIGSNYIIDPKLLKENSSYATHLAYEFFKISNRFTGNALLFESLKKKELLDEAPADRLMQCARDMSVRWNLLRSLYLKYCKSNLISDIDKIEKKAIGLFINEKELWLDFINGLPG